MKRPTTYSNSVTQTHGARWWPVLAFAVVIAVATGALWIAQNNQEHQHIRQVLANENKSIALRIQAHLDTRVSALKRMADRWGKLGKPPRDAWEQDAASYVNDFGDFQALEWVDSSYHIRWVVPLEGNEKAQNLNLAFEPHRRVALEAAKESRSVTMTKPINLVQGGKGFLVYCPIYHDQMFEGFILGVFRFDKLFENLQQHADVGTFHKRIRMGQDVVFDDTHDDPDADWNRLVHHQESMSLYGVPWTMDLAPSGQTLSELQSPLKELTLIVGVAVGLLLVVMTRLAQVLRWRSGEMAKVNQQLKSEATAREQAQNKVSRSEELFRKTIEASPSGLIMADRQGVITLVNQQAEAMFGYTREELLGQKVEMLLPPDIRKAHVGYRTTFFGAPDTRAMGQGRDLLGCRKDGTQFPIETGLNPLETPDGMQVLATVVDITERKENEALLHRHMEELTQTNKELDKQVAERTIAEERFKATIEVFPTAMVIVDQQGSITLVNEHTETLFGYERSELLGQPIEMLIPERYRKKHVGQRDGFIASPAIRSMGLGRELFGLRKDGTEFPIEIGLSPQKTPEGINVLAAVVDITERKKNEALLRRHMEELTQTNKELDDFAYVASHDLRSPLEGIKKLSTWVIKDNADALPDKSKRHLEQMQQRISRLENLLGDLLQYSRAGRVNTETLLVDTGQLARDLADLNNLPDGFTISVAPDMPTLVTAKTPLETVMRNLISNAVKHHNRTDGIINVSCQPNGQSVEFKISDDGPGIDPQFHDQIFGLFETLRPRDEVEGSGMGLAIVKKLVESYGGKITVASENGQGTTFRFTWPKTMN